MRKYFPGLKVVVAAACMLAGCAHFGAGGWVTLIDGARGLEHWIRAGDANWRAEAGAIVADAGKGGYLVTRGAYRDFELRAEFWAESATNSGIFLRCADPASISQAVCYEVNIWDTRPDPRYATGAIVDVAAVPVPLPNKAGGRWNTYEIRAQGTQLTVRLNGVETASVSDAKHASGPIALQYGAGIDGARGAVIRWRKLQIRPL